MKPLLERRAFGMHRLDLDHLWEDRSWDTFSWNSLRLGSLRRLRFCLVVCLVVFRTVYGLLFQIGIPGPDDRALCDESIIIPLHGKIIARWPELTLEHPIGDRFGRLDRAAVLLGGEIRREEFRFGDVFRQKDISELDLARIHIAEGLDEQTIERELPVGPLVFLVGGFAKVIFSGLLGGISGLVIPNGHFPGLFVHIDSVDATVDDHLSVR